MRAPVSLDQRRAASAYAYAATAGDLDRAQKLPMMLQINGLLATWAFLLAKKEQDLLLALLRHLRDVVPEIGKHGDTVEGAFLRWIGGPGREGDGIDGKMLRALTAEALAWSVWLKRATEAKAPADTRKAEVADAGA